MSNPSADRLNEISGELASIVETRIQDLLSAMKSAEQSTRQIVTTEMEISRYKAISDSLGAERDTLQSEAATLKARAEEVQTAHGRALAERDRQKEDCGRGERTLDGLREQCRTLTEQNESITVEVGELRTKIKGLEDNIERMKKMREDLMTGFGDLGKQMSKSNLGGQD